MTIAFCSGMPIGSARRAALLLLCFFMSAGMPAQAQDIESPAQALDILFRGYAQDAAPYFPFTATENGQRQYDSVFPNNLREDYRAGLKKLCADYLRQLRRFDPNLLPVQDRLSRDIFERRLVTCLEGFETQWHLMPIDQNGNSWPASFPVIGSGRGSHPFKTQQNYEDFLKRIDGFVEWVDSAIANMRIGVAQGYTQPRDIMLKVLPQLDAHIVSDPRASMFFEPLNKFPDDMEQAVRAVLTEKYLAAIESKIVPAYRRLRVFIADEYLPRCRRSAGIGSLPDGPAMYLMAVRHSTTTDMAPDRIHELGLAEVGRIGSEIRKLRAEIDAAGTPQLTRHQDVDSLLNGYRGLRAELEQNLPRLFGRFPKNDFEIRAIEPFREKSMSSSYIFPPVDGARPGVFYLNAAALKTAGHEVVSRSLFIHEAIPGHHTQVALQRENKALPMFRRLAWYTAFGEGWALYAEGLGDELGMYRNPRDRLIMLQAELLRAARLVVDTGLHHKGWSRQQAIDYLRQAGQASADSAEREAERYMTWPGQALSYKIGQLKIRELRGKAERQLGAGFDIRAFHDELLRDGAMPLDILEAKMDRWLAAQKPAGR